MLEGRVKGAVQLPTTLEPKLLCCRKPHYPTITPPRALAGVSHAAATARGADVILGVMSVDSGGRQAAEIT